jgi:hypothetical protein
VKQRVEREGDGHEDHADHKDDEGRFGTEKVIALGPML